MGQVNQAGQVHGMGPKLTAVQEAILDALKMAPGGAAGTKGLSDSELQKGVEQRLGNIKLTGNLLAQYRSGLPELVKLNRVVVMGAGAATRYKIKV